MVKPLLFVAMTLQLSVGLLAPTRAAALPMDLDFMNFQEKPAVLSKGRAEQIDEFSYLFVGGYGNELARGHYFKFNIQSLREMGATFADSYFPSSFRAAGANLEALRAEVLRAFRQSGERPVMLFGHSKGGLESLALVLKYPELIRDGIVANVTLIQAPIGGNSLADESRLLTRLTARALRLAPGFHSLQTVGINSLIKDKIDKLRPEDLRLVSRAVRYVVSHKDSADASFVIHAVTRALGHQPKNDLLVAKSDMWIPGFGTILGSLYINHFEVVMGRAIPLIAENLTYDYVRAFTESMIVNLLRSRNRNTLQYRFLTENQMVERFGARSCADLFYQIN